MMTISGLNVLTLNVMNQPIKKFLKLLSQRIKKYYYKTLGTSVINSPMSFLNKTADIKHKDHVTA